MIRGKALRRAMVGSLGVLMLGAGAYAANTPEDEGTGRRHGRHGMAPFRMARALDLTDEQRAAFKQILEEQHKASEPLRTQHRELREQIRQQLEGNADATTVGQLTIQAHAVGKQLHESRAQVRERFEALLTPEQKAKLEALKSQRGTRERGRPGRPRSEKPAADRTEL